MFRRHAPFLAIVAMAAFVRLWGLDWLPSPAGDEGNWTLYGLQISKGEEAALAENASFVSLLYAHLIAASMKIFGAGFFAARLVGTVAILLTVAAAYALPTALGARRFGIVLAAVLALHPWSVAYSRICSVPYALALAVTTIGPLLFAAGLRQRRIAMVAAGVAVVSLGAHFSPLTACAPVACALYALRPPHRWIFRRWELYAAVALGALHAFPVVRSAMAVAGDAPPLNPFHRFWSRAGTHLHMVLTGLGGEATLRHFTNVALSPRAALLTGVPVVAFALVAATRRAREASPFGAFGPLWLLVSLVLTPLILMPGREWDLPANHMDRYLFSLLPGLAMCVAGVAALPHRAAIAAAAAFVAWLGVNDGRLAWAFLAGGGVDHGEGIYDGGGGYRGWLVSDRPRPVAVQVRDEILRLVGPGGGGAVIVADRTFIPLTFVMDGTGIPVHDVRRTWIPPEPHGRYFVLLWPDHVMSTQNPPTAPEKYVRSNEELRRRLGVRFTSKRLVRDFRQRDGSPLLELWLAEKPKGERLGVK